MEILRLTVRWPAYDFVGFETRPPPTPLVPTGLWLFHDRGGLVNRGLGNLIREYCMLPLTGEDGFRYPQVRSQSIPLDGPGIRNARRAIQTHQ